ncbi:hypothetical protein CK203_089045 [Vitis vinifera]|uniref:Uncharacterized protein n=1 Tax=Vitis vinifera TaxID=29760 RepID=A0A438F5S5_VITVI|nr:hypothetical protein CK203_089045 [Vitis vinifera]
MTMTPFTSLLQVLFKHLQEKLYVTETKLKESQFQLAPWRSDVNHSNFSPQSPPHSIGAALTTSIKNGLELVPQPAYSPGMIPSSSDVQTPSNWNILGHHQSGFGGMAKNLESEDLGRYSPPASRMADTDRRGNFGGLLKRLNKVVGMMIEQAHDHVNWDFSFGDKMYGALKKWMEKIFCTSMVQLQFLSMGLLQVSLEFEGLRQGNSLSLFVPADVEMVSCFISVAVEEVLSVASNWKEEVVMRLRFPIFWPRINLDMNELISMGGMEDLGILTSEVWSYSWALVLPFGSFLKSNFVWDQRKGYLLVGNNTCGWMVWALEGYLLLRKLHFGSGFGDLVKGGGWEMGVGIGKC